RPGGTRRDAGVRPGVGAVEALLRRPRRGGRGEAARAALTPLGGGSLPPGVSTAQVADVLEAIEEVLGPDVLGVYLHGSAVAGRLHHRSDLDVLVVVDREPDPSVRAALVGALLPVGRRAGRRPEDRSLELTVVVRSHVVPWRYPPTQAFQYGE